MQTPSNRFILRPIFIFLSQIFRFASYIYHRAYDLKILKVHKLDAYCISVGNLAVGGSGKSPVVIAIAKHLLMLGKKPAILARGYGSGLSTTEFAYFLNGALQETTAKAKTLFADEARMQSANLPGCPVILGKNRHLAARWYQSLTQQIPTHYILDDGMQRRNIHRDFNICLLDHERPLHNGYFLPAGDLRENENALKRADFILFTRAKSKVKTRNFGRPYDLVRFETEWPKTKNNIPYEKKPGQKPLIFCAIAHGERFLESLRTLGIEAADRLILRDHQVLSQANKAFLLEKKQPIILSEKDYWREPDFWNTFAQEVYIARLKIDFDRGINSWLPA